MTYAAFVARDLTNTHNSSDKFAQMPAVGFICIRTYQDQTAVTKVMEPSRFRRLKKFFTRSLHPSRQH